MAWSGSVSCCILKAPPRSTARSPAKPRGSNEPLVIVGIQLADLQAGLDGHASGGGPVSAETVRKLACEGSVIPMIFNSDGVVLDMGRKTRFATRHR